MHPFLTAALLGLLGAVPALAQQPVTIRDRGADVTFPMGAASFADQVVSFRPGDPASDARNSDPRAALGLPDRTRMDDGKSVSLGCGGALVLGFTDNALVDVPGPDLYVFEVGQGVEGTEVAISENGTDWIQLGAISGGTASVDIADSLMPPGVEYTQVRLTDRRDSCGGRHPGADIDTIAAIGSVPRAAQRSEKPTLPLPEGKQDTALAPAPKMPPETGTKRTAAQEPTSQATDPQGIAPDNATPRVQSMMQDLAQDGTADLGVEFELDSAQLTPEDRAVIADFAEAVRALNPDSDPGLSIYGHTDSRGSEDYNYDLSDRRAAAIRQALVQDHGFDMDKLRSLGLGESEPRFPDDPEADGNRRVEVRMR